MTLFFKYGTSDDEDTWESTPGQVVIGTGDRVVYEDAPASLLPNTTYSYRAYASYADGVVAASKSISTTTSSTNQIMKVF